MNIAHLLVRAGCCFADHPAVALSGDVRRDYAGLADRSAVLGGALRDGFGLEAGDRVGLVMNNTPAYVEILFAVWHAGLVAVPINAKLAAAEIGYIVEHSGAQVSFATPGLAETLDSLRTDTGLREVVDVTGPRYAALFQGEPAPVANREPDAAAWLFYTSGTTGTPKGALLTHRNLGAMTHGYFTDVDPITPDDAILHAAPMSHGSGLYILPHVAAGALHIIPVSGGFDPHEIFDLLRVHRNVSFFAAPTMVKRLTNAADTNHPDTGNLKTIIYGGGPMYLADLKAAIATFGNKFAQIYGQGESPMTITAMPKWMHAQTAHPRFEQRLASVGIPQSMLEVSVIDGDGRALPPNETGEIVVRGDAVMRGYWRDPQATARALVDGWLYTGDVGRFDDDGFLTLHDRSKDVIISGGSNIYPREVEEALLQHEAVAEACVIGRGDSEWGETVVAFIVRREGMYVDADGLNGQCLKTIARFKRPREYRFVDELQKNAYGKVLKNALQKTL